MTIATRSTIRGRIKVAGPLSPIAVFKRKDPEKPFDAVFADTVVTQERLRWTNKPNGLLGVFHGATGVADFDYITKRFSQCP